MSESAHNGTIMSKCVRKLIKCCDLSCCCSEKSVTRCLLKKTVALSGRLTSTVD